MPQGKPKSVLQVLKDELEAAREKIEDRDRLAQEVLALKVKCANAGELEKAMIAMKREMEEANTRADTIENRMSDVQKEKLNLEEQLKTIDKTLKMKLYAIRRLEKNMSWEKRALESSKNKVREMERKNKMLDASAKLDRELKEKMEADLKDQTGQVTRERALRLLQLHKHERVVRKQQELINTAVGLPEKAKLYEKLVDAMKQEMIIMKQAIKVEQGMNNSLEEELERNTIKIANLESRSKDMERVIRKRARENQEWRDRFDNLRSKFEWMQSKLVSRLRGMNSASEVAEVMAVTAPAIPSMLDSDWGFGDGRNRDRLDALPNYMSNTHSHQQRIRGKPPQEVMSILENELLGHQETLQNLRHELDERIKEHSASELRREALVKQVEVKLLEVNQKKEIRDAANIDLETLVKKLFDVRAEARQRTDLLRRRRVREQEEKDPYAAPRKLKRGYKLPDTHTAAIRVQAASRSRHARRSFVEKMETLQTNLQSEIDEQKRVCAEFPGQIERLEEVLSGMETKLTLQRDATFEIAGKIRELRVKRIPREEKLLEAKAEGLQDAKRQVDQANMNFEFGLADTLTSTIEYGLQGHMGIPNGNLSSIVIPEDTAVSMQSKFTYSAKSAAKVDAAIANLTESIAKERGWNSGGHGAPRYGLKRSLPGKPLAFPALLPPRVRRSLRDHERQVLLDAMVNGEFDEEWDENDEDGDIIDNSMSVYSRNVSRQSSRMTSRMPTSRTSISAETNINSSMEQNLANDSNEYNFSKQSLSADKAHALLRNILSGPESPWGVDDSFNRSEHKSVTNFSTLPKLGAIKYKRPERENIDDGISVSTKDGSGNISARSGNISARSGNISARSGNISARSSSVLSIKSGVGFRGRSSNNFSRKASTRKKTPKSLRSVSRKSSTYGSRRSAAKASFGSEGTSANNNFTQSTNRKGSMFLAGQAKSDYMVNADDIQRQLPVDTRGSAKMVVSRIRKSIQEAELSKREIVPEDEVSNSTSGTSIQQAQEVKI